ncbi:MAG: RNA polymerase sigma factor [Sandaracinaceae bacterium]
MTDPTDDRERFGAALVPLLPRLRSFAFRMLAHPEDAEDAVQEALAKAYRDRESFRGEAKLTTWIFSILTRTCLDRLRHRRRWRWDAQHLTRVDGDAPHAEVEAVLADPEHTFDVHEHITFCFTCVARSLPPEEAAAVLLREVFGFGNREAARICGVSEPVLRHRLSAGRRAMQDAFDRLCALVNKEGVCYQCSGLRERAARPGPPAPDLSGTAEDSYRTRLRVLSRADLESGRSAKLHRTMLEAVRGSEARRNRASSSSSGS